MASQRRAELAIGNAPDAHVARGRRTRHEVASGREGDRPDGAGLPLEHPPGPFGDAVGEAADSDGAVCRAGCEVAAVARPGDRRDVAWMAPERGHRLIQRCGEAVEFDRAGRAGIPLQPPRRAEQSLCLADVVAIAGLGRQEDVGDVELRPCGCRLPGRLFLAPLRDLAGVDGHMSSLHGECPLPFSPQVEHADPRDGDQQRRQHADGRRGRCPVAAGKPQHGLDSRRGPRQDRLARLPPRELSLHLDRRRIPITRPLLQALRRNRGQGAGIEGREATGLTSRPLHRPRGRRRRIAEDPCGFHRRPAAEVVGQHAGDDLMEHEAEGIDVRTGVDIAVIDAQLFRAHVPQRAHHVARPGHRGVVVTIRVGRSGHAKVDHLRLAHSVDEDVARFEVAMDHALLMAVGDRRTHQPKHRHTLADRRGLLLDKPGDRPGLLDELHHEKGHHAVAAAIGIRAEGVDQGDVGVPQPREHVGLVLKPPCKRRREQADPHDLHGHRSGRGFLPRFIHAAHPPFRKHADERHPTEICAQRWITPRRARYGSHALESKPLLGTAQQ